LTGSGGIYYRPGPSLQATFQNHELTTAIGDLKTEYIISPTPEPEVEGINLKLEQNFAHNELPLAKWEPEDERMDDLDIDAEPVAQSTSNYIQFSTETDMIPFPYPTHNAQSQKDSLLEIREDSYIDDSNDVLFVSSNSIQERGRLTPPDHSQLIDLTC
jgi:hypothetical protein